MAMNPGVRRSDTPRQSELGNFQRHFWGEFTRQLQDAKAAKWFFKGLQAGLQYAPRMIITDKLRSYGVARRHLLPHVEHRQSRYLNNRAQDSHRPTRRLHGGHPNLLYPTTKGTIINLTRTLAGQLGQDGIRVNCFPAFFLQR